MAPYPLVKTKIRKNPTHKTRKSDAISDNNWLLFSFFRCTFCSKPSRSMCSRFTLPSTYLLGVVGFHNAPEKVFPKFVTLGGVGTCMGSEELHYVPPITTFSTRIKL